jgi:bifunctional non-homologous end joining protein LigD
MGYPRTNRITSRRPLRKAAKPRAVPPAIPPSAPEAELEIGGHRLRLTHLQKPFWPKLGLTKGDLLRYYAEVSSVLVPHLVHRAMVMKRYPDGAGGKSFFQKRVPEPHPDWIELCPIDHPAAGLVQFPVVADLPSLLWVINLGCIDLHPWYARCDDNNRPDYLHFDLDPGEGAGFDRVRETAWLVHEALETLRMPNFAKTTGSRGIHVYVPIERGPTQKEVWTFAKELAQSLAILRPKMVTAEYRVSKRPPRRVLVDYNQNAWGRTLASVYSVRPTPRATVSMPVTWEEIRRGIRIEDFHLGNAAERVRTGGDLWASLLKPKGRFKLEPLLTVSPRPAAARSQDLRSSSSRRARS